MATRAVYTFTGFSGKSDHHLYLHHDGYPTGAAWRFAVALSETPEPASFLAAFLSSQPRAEPIESPEQAADAEYRYRAVAEHQPSSFRAGRSSSDHVHGVAVAPQLAVR